MSRYIATLAIAALAAFAVGAQTMEGVLVPVQAPSVASAVAAPVTTAAPIAAATDQTFPRSGIASWYGPEFEGKPTASGERFDSSLLTAAHPSLPFGSILRVTNSQNGRKVDVRVNDRGPFVAARIIDVSRAAAEKLDMIVTGTAPVTLELVGMAGNQTPAPAQTPAAMPAAAPTAAPAPTPAQTPAAIPAAAPTAVPESTAAPAVRSTAVPVASQPVVAPPVRKSAELIPKAPDGASGKRYRLQVGSYKLAQNAAEAFNRLSSAGFEPSYERSGDLYRIVLVSVAAADVERYAERLGGAGFAQALIREER